MIRSDKGEVEFKGNIIDILIDFSCIIAALRDAMEERITEEEAMMLLKQTFDNANRHHDEIETETKRVLLAQALMNMSEHDREKIKRMMEEKNK